MAIFKCKMCGGQLEIENGAAVCECEYCGTQQTLGNIDLIASFRPVKLSWQAMKISVTPRFFRSEHMLA